MGAFLLSCKCWHRHKAFACISLCCDPTNGRQHILFHVKLLGSLPRLSVYLECDFWHFQLAIPVAWDFLKVLKLFGPMDFEKFQSFDLKGSRSLQTQNWLRPEMTAAAELYPPIIQHCFHMLSYSVILAQGGWADKQFLFWCSSARLPINVFLRATAYQERGKTSPNPLISCKPVIFLNEILCFQTLAKVVQVSWMAIMIYARYTLRFFSAMISISHRNSNKKK